MLVGRQLGEACPDRLAGCFPGEDVRDQSPDGLL